MWQEFIKQILSVLNAVEYDLLTALLAMSLLVSCMLVNQILGSVMASTVNEFDIKRLLKSLLKGFLICISLLIFCIVLDVFPVLLERVGLIGNEQLMSTVTTVVEVLVILVLAIIKYCKEIYNKLLTLFDVKKENVDEVIQTTFNTEITAPEDSDVDGRG